MPDAQCAPLPNVLKHGFYTRRFSNRSFYNRCFCGQERLELETLSEEGLDNEIAMLTIYLISRLSSFVYRPIIRSSSFRDYFLLKNIHQ